MEEFDDLDQLKLQGLARLDQANRHAAEQQEELKSVRRELRKLRDEQERTRLLPQCPVCGGRIESGYRKCKQCASDLAWVEGIPCEPGRIEELRRTIHDRRAREAAEAQRLELEREASRRPCAHCKATFYADQLSRKSFCPECAAEKRRQSESVGWLIGGVGASLGCLFGYLLANALFTSTGAGTGDDLAHALAFLVVICPSGMLGFFAGVFAAAPLQESMLPD